MMILLNIMYLIGLVALLSPISAALQILHKNYQEGKWLEFTVQLIIFICILLVYIVAVVMWKGDILNAIFR